MKPCSLCAALVVCFACLAMPGIAASEVANILAAVADSNRPEADRQRDSNSKPAIRAILEPRKCLTGRSAVIKDQFMFKFRKAGKHRAASHPLNVEKGP